jgi:hypothetical protein
MEILVLSFWNLKTGFIIRNYVPHISMTIATKYFNYVSAQYVSDGEQEEGKETG